MADETNVVAEEVAEAEFSRFAEMMDLDLEPSGWDAEDRKSFDDAKGKILRAVRRGKLIINENGEPVYTAANGKKITFHEPDGAAIMAIDLAKKNHDAAKGFKILAAMTKEPPAVFAPMPNRDLKVCMAVQILFLQSG